MIDEELFARESTELRQLVDGRFEMTCISTSGELTQQSLADSIINAVALDSAQVLTTTRLDNDDSLAPDFVLEMRKAASDCENLPCVLDFPRGIVVDRQHNMVLERGYYRSAFQTLVEIMGLHGKIQTVFKHSHHLLGDHFTYRVANSSKPMWIMNVHRANVANQAWGLPRDRRSVRRDLHPLLPECLPTPGQSFLYFVAMSYRYMRFLIKSGSYIRRAKSVIRNLYPDR